MSWSPLHFAQAPKAAERRSPVMLSMVPAGRYCAALRLLIRRDDLPELGFIERGTHLSAELGFGEHAGKLRISRGRGVIASNAGGRGIHVVSVRLPVPAGVPVKPHAKAPVDFVTGDGMLTITLPSWAMPSSPPPEPAKGGMERGMELAREAAAAARRRAGL